LKISNADFITDKRQFIGYKVGVFSEAKHVIWCKKIKNCIVFYFYPFYPIYPILY